MIFSSGVARTMLIAGLLHLVGLTTGCDKQRAFLAAAIQPRTAQQVTATVSQQLAEGKFKEARADAENFLSSNQDTTGQLVWALAKACGQLGDADSAIKYASQAVAAGAVFHVDMMVEPMLEPVRTDPRFVALAAGTTAGASNPPQAAHRIPAEPLPAVASATIGANGIEAKAGSVSVRLPD